jgi:hypothetical protein
VPEGKKVLQSYQEGNPGWFWSRIEEIKNSRKMQDLQQSFLKLKLGIEFKLE